MTSQKNTTEWNRQDRDLLIKLETKLDGVVADIKDMKDSTLSRLAMVEAGKLDRTEANRLQAEAMEIHGDHETRLRFVERYMWLALGGLAVIEFALNYFHPFVH